MPVFHAVTFNLFNNNNTEYIQNDSVVVEYLFEHFKKLLAK